MALDLNLISIIVFYSLIAVYFFIKRKNITREYGIFFLYRTQKFTSIMRRIANLSPRFWRWFGYASIPVGFAGMFAIFSYLAYALAKLFFVPSAAPSVSLIIPGVRIPGSVFVPFWYGIIALFVVIVVHEGMHGVVSEAWKLKLKSSGVGLLAFLPLAFVEPPENQLKKAKLSTQLSIFSAGVFANAVTAGVVLLISTFALAPLASGIYVADVQEGMPAAIAGLAAGDIIYKVNGAPIKYSSDFATEMQKLKPSDKVTLSTAAKTTEAVAIENPSAKGKAYIGISFRQAFPYFGLFEISNLLYWIFVFNIGIGIINLLPLGPIDGGRMLGTLLQNKVKNKKLAMKLFSTVSTASLLLLLANIFLPYVVRAFMV